MAGGSAGVRMCNLSRQPSFLSNGMYISTLILSQPASMILDTVFCLILFEKSGGRIEKASSTSWKELGMVPLGGQSEAAPGPSTRQ